MKLFILWVVYASSFELPLCIHCKHYKRSFLDSKYGKCSLFNIVTKDDSYLVNGVKTKDVYHYYCSTARGSQHMCGEEGKYFEKK